MVMEMEHEDQMLVTPEEISREEQVTVPFVEESVTETTEMEEREEQTNEISWEETLAAEATALREIYPGFELNAMMEDPAFRALAVGEVKPTLRQVYEMLCPDVVMETRVQARVQETVSAAVESAVAEAVARAESNLLRHIQTRGMRPRENGSNAATGVRTHPAVHRLTREDRAKLAMMAQRGENVQL